MSTAPANQTSRTLPFGEQLPAGAVTDPYAPISVRAQAEPWDQNSTLVVVDARHMAYRSHHTRDLRAPDGTPTSALHGMIEMLAGVCSAARTNRVLLAWDGKDSLKHRRAVHGQYKVRVARSSLSEDEVHQAEVASRSIEVAREWLDNLGLPSVYATGLEADDVAGIVVGFSLSEPPDWLHRVVLVSDDKDWLQLVCPGVAVFRGIGKELVDDAAFVARYTVSPEQWADVKALVGEPEKGDNIPGVKSIGEKTAISLIVANGGIEGVIAACQSLEKSGRASAKERAIAAAADDARLSYRLARINTTLGGVFNTLPSFNAACVDLAEREIREALQRAHSGASMNPRAVADLRGRLGFGQWVDGAMRQIAGVP